MTGIVNSVIGVLAGIGGVVGIRAGIEAPPYTVLERAGAVEIRRYEPRLAAETTVAGPVMSARSAGFRAVAGYIFGGNTAREGVAMTAPVAQTAAKPQTIAMTAPVAQAPAGGPDQWRVQFFMPAGYTRETLPVPNDPAVRIVEVPAQDYAVLRFTGKRDGATVAARTLALQSSLPRGWRSVGEPTAWFYDPPWTVPFLRRNEVAQPVERAP